MAVRVYRSSELGEDGNGLGWGPGNQCSYCVGVWKAKTMKIGQAGTDREIAACYPVMRELRPHVPENEFVSRVRRQEKSGYRLVAAEAEKEIVAVAGFRIGESLAWGRFLYVDDLVTSKKHRSKGYGAKLLLWLREYAVSENCKQLHLDSGLQREDTHRFYEREGMSKGGFHFVESLSPSKA